MIQQTLGTIKNAACSDLSIYIHRTFSLETNNDNNHWSKHPVYGDVSSYAVPLTWDSALLRSRKHECGWGP